MYPWIRRTLSVIGAVLILPAAFIGYIAIDIQVVGFWSERSSPTTERTMALVFAALLLLALALIYLILRWGWRKRGK